MACLLGIYLLIVPASASEADLDQADYYEFAPVKVQAAALRFNQSASQGSYTAGGTKIQYYGFDSPIKIGSYTIPTAADANVKTLAAAVILANENNLKYTDSAIASALSADLVPIQSLLNMYLPRIDTNTGSLHGDLLNIQSALGWTAGSDTLLTVVRDIRTELGDFHSSFLDFIQVLLTSIDSGFHDVTSRQDSFYKFWSSAGSWSGFAYRDSVTGITSSAFSSFPAAFAESQRSLIELLSSSWNSVLGPNGNVISTSGSRNRPSLTYIVQSGLIGLSRNLVGPGSASFSAWRGPDQFRTVTSNNLLGMLSLIGANLQQPLAKLQYVWADDDDIRIAQKNQPVKDKVEENFVGDGEAAVKTSDVDGMAGIGGSIKSTFAGSGSVGDVFSVLGDSGNYGFFSQEVADALDTVNSPAVVSEADEWAAFYDSYWVDDAGVAHSKDMSLFDLSSYLEGLS